MLFYGYWVVDGIKFKDTRRFWKPMQLCFGKRTPAERHAQNSASSLPVLRLAVLQKKFSLTAFRLPSRDSLQRMKLP